MPNIHKKTKFKSGRVQLVRELGAMLIGYR